MHYSKSAQNSDLPEDVFKEKQKMFLKNLVKFHDEIQKPETQIGSNI